MTIDELVALLQGLNACSGGIDWLRSQPDPETAWRDCQAGLWMEWPVSKLLPGDPRVKQFWRLIDRQNDLHPGQAGVPVRQAAYAAYWRDAVSYEELEAAALARLERTETCRPRR